MLNLTDHLRRLKVDKYEYVAMKVIVLLSSGEFLKMRRGSNFQENTEKQTYQISDSAELKEPEKVRESQEKALQALQAYTLCKFYSIQFKINLLKRIFFLRSLY